MDDLGGWIGRLIQAGGIPVIAVGSALWNMDKALSAAGAKRIFSYIQGAADQPASAAIDREISAVLASWFSRSQGFWPFFRNVAVLTLASLAVLLSIYTARTSGMAQTLLTPGFLKQFLGNGLVVTFLVNWFTFTLYDKVLADLSVSSFSRSIAILLVDAAVKLLLFFVFTALTYMLMAAFGNSFGGRLDLAILSVPRTILLALEFKNLTGVYFYSVAISSFPIFVVALVRMMAGSPGFAKAARRLIFWLPVDKTPLRAVAVVFALFIGTFSVVAAVLLTPLANA